MNKLRAVLIITLANLLISSSIFGQSPEKMSYQAVIRDASDNLVTSQPVGMQISILQTSASGTAVYVERHFPTTNANGLVSIEIGTGTVVSGDFTTINWSNGPYFIKTETDPTGGTSYTITGTSQLLSVPYALHAKTAENLTGNLNEKDPVFNNWDKSTGISITESQITDLQNYLTSEVDSSVTNEIQVLSISNDTVYLSNGGFVKLPAETDPQFGAWNKSTGISITESQITDLQNYLTIEVDSSVTNEIQVLSISNDTVYLSNGGFVKLPAETDPQFGAWNKSTGISITESQITDLQNYLTSEVDSSVTNEIQVLSISNDTVYLSNGGFVKLPAETDPQFGAWNKSTGISITESQITDLQNYLTSEVDSSVTNEIQVLSISNDTVYLSNGGFVKLPAETDPQFGAWNKSTGISITESQITDLQNYLTSEVDSSVTNEIQVLSISNDTVYLSNGGFVKLPAETDPQFGAWNKSTGISITESQITDLQNYLTSEVDSSITNEIQVLSISNDTVYLSNGGFVKLPAPADGSETKVTAGTNVTVSGIGTIASPYIVNVPGAAPLAIGDSFGNGIICWLDSTGQSGLIAAAADQSTGIKWYNGSYTITNAIRDGIGAGMYNTERIIANQSSGSYAAQLCANYQGGGYGDWYLPSKYELNLLYQQKTAVGGFSNDYYWSSSEGNGNYAWRQHFLYGYQYYKYKDYMYRVRCIRSF
ncbi:MAG: DUF1566 domain-containing protein [candidate division Zixibacteria bacterium]|nr:DUF1566 domain-containing protein [candidate division Zixibacteria bacterium]